jgi:hypothetical protein
MLTVNDLCIGNWVKAPLGEWMQVTQLGHKDNPDYIFAEGPQGFGQNHFEGIPILEALHTIEYYKCSDFYDIENHTFKLGKNGSLWLYINNVPMAECIYLHQLQNLIRAWEGYSLALDLLNSDTAVQECDASKAEQRSEP